MFYDNSRGVIRSGAITSLLRVRQLHGGNLVILPSNVLGVPREGLIS